MKVKKEAVQQGLQKSGETALTIAFMLMAGWGIMSCLAVGTELANEQAGLATPTPEPTVTPTPTLESGGITMGPDESLIRWVEW